ncbi:unnamed protein product [Vitrella brassicaformis CCMP3155]|uniref:Uncharacterized protein n=1 Tax=Vitrella brassicaformis (strain CCMP3155) TaxID=1169540 RepID=A0A0G4EFH6_VITBC|nr:unnamed protein product [Vitrella brassicaformis CCMP3155]|eukprot:CEL94123.1 unnamed protein product [Vitrella brassicaformis CCMP3155]
MDDCRVPVRVCSGRSEASDASGEANRGPRGGQFLIRPRQQPDKDKEGVPEKAGVRHDERRADRLYRRGHCCGEEDTDRCPPVKCSVDGGARLLPTFSRNLPPQHRSHDTDRSSPATRRYDLHRSMVDGDSVGGHNGQPDPGIWRRDAHDDPDHTAAEDDCYPPSPSLPSPAPISPRPSSVGFSKPILPGCSHPQQEIDKEGGEGIDDGPGVFERVMGRHAHDRPGPPMAAAWAAKGGLLHRSQVNKEGVMWAVAPKHRRMEREGGHVQQMHKGRLDRDEVTLGPSATKASLRHAACLTVRSALRAAAIRHLAGAFMRLRVHTHSGLGGADAGFVEPMNSACVKQLSTFPARDQRAAGPVADQQPAADATWSGPPAHAQEVMREGQLWGGGVDEDPSGSADHMQNIIGIEVVNGQVIKREVRSPAPPPPATGAPARTPSRHGTATSRPKRNFIQENMIAVAAVRVCEGQEGQRAEELCCYRKSGAEATRPEVTQDATDRQTCVVVGTNGGE